MMKKLHSNPMLPEVYNNLVTSFLSESMEAFFERDFSKDQSQDFNNALDSSKKIFELSTDLFKSWQQNTSDLMQNVMSGKDVTENYKKLFGTFQEYSRGLLGATEQNIKGFAGEQKDEHNTLKFLWEEFSKMCNPKNIPSLNDEIINKMRETSCENLLKGTEMFLNDVQNSPDGYFMINTVDTKAFELGKNLAATKGKVVFQNKLMQLICYENTTENTHTKHQF